MVWRFIVPPPNTGDDTRFFISDSTNHPLNDPGDILIVEDNEEPLPSCCCAGGEDICCFFADCDDVPLSVSLALSGFGCALDDTFTLTLDSCDEIEGSGVTFYRWGVSTTADNCNISIQLFCNNPDAGGWSCQITVTDLLDGNVTADWGMFFNTISCDPLLLTSYDFTSNGFSPAEATEACDCQEPASPGAVSGTVTE